MCSELWTFHERDCGHSFRPSLSDAARCWLPNQDRGGNPEPNRVETMRDEATEEEPVSPGAVRAKASVVLCGHVRQFASLPGFHLLSHGLEVSLHSVNPDRDAVD